MKTNAGLTYEKIRFDEPKEMHLVVTLDAPGMDAAFNRPPVCVVPSIDVSGSMGGEKLRFAKQSVRKLIEHLAPGDFFGAVAFTDGVEVVSPALEITQAKKEQLLAVVAKLEAQASTNFAGGLVHALALANARGIPEKMIRRVIMFTDGRANVGVETTRRGIVALLREHRGRATVSAFGYGEDADHELLSDVSRAGDGAYAFIRESADALGAFGHELGGLLSTYARDIVIEVRPAAGVTLLDVVSDVDSLEPLEGGVRITIPEILAQERRQIVVAVRMEEDPRPGGQSVVSVEGRYARAVPSSPTPLKPDTFSHAGTVLRVRAGEEQTEPTRELDEAVVMAQLVRAQIDAEERAGRGDFAGAQNVMRLFQREAVRRKHDVAAEASERVLRAMESAAVYEKSAGFRTSMKKGMTRSVAAALDADVLDLIEEAGMETVTYYQEAMVDRFTSSGDAEEPPAADSSNHAGPAAPHSGDHTGQPARKRGKSKRSLARRRHLH